MKLLFGELVCSGCVVTVTRVYYKFVANVVRNFKRILILSALKVDCTRRSVNARRDVFVPKPEVLYYTLVYKNTR